MAECPKCGETVYAADRVEALGGEWHKACLACAQCGCKLNPSVPGLLQERDGVPFCKRCAAQPAAAAAAQQPKASPAAPAPAATPPVWAAARDAGGIGKPVAPSPEIDDDGDFGDDAPPAVPPAPVAAPEAPVVPAPPAPAAEAPAPASPKPAASPSAAKAVPPPAESPVKPQAAKELAGARRATLPPNAASLTRCHCRIPAAKFQAMQGPTPPPPQPGSARDIAGAHALAVSFRCPAVLIAKLRSQIPRYGGCSCHRRCRAEAARCCSRSRACGDALPQMRQEGL
jgi:hypothetical protein